MKKKIQRTSSSASSGKGKASFGNESYNRSTRINKKWVDEEIESGSDDNSDEEKDGNTENDDNKDEDDNDNLETADQKRRRLAIRYLETIQTKSADDSDKDSEADSDDDNDYDQHTKISKLLKIEREKLQGKYFKKFDFKHLNLSNDSLTANSRQLSGHKSSITSAVLSYDDTTAYTGSKDNSVISWDIETGEILTVAVSYDNKYVASGGRDNIIRIYDPRVGKNSEIKTLTGHRDIVTCLAFRKDIISASQTPKYALFSGSMDRTLKHWDLNEMAYIETMFGHQEGVLGLDCWYKNKPLSCSSDRTTRIWSVEEESHNVYRSTKVTSSIDCVAYISENEFVTGGQDGCLSIYKSNLKKPVYKVSNAHGFETANIPRWICSMAAMPMSDLLLTGSYDGTIKFWKLSNMNSSMNLANSNSKILHNKKIVKKSAIDDDDDDEDADNYEDDDNDDDDEDEEDVPAVRMKPKDKDNLYMKLTNEINNLPGFVNSLAVSRKVLIAGLGREHRLGRWWNNKQGHNKLFIMKLENSFENNNNHNENNHNHKSIRNSSYDLKSQ